MNKYDNWDRPLPQLGPWEKIAAELERVTAEQARERFTGRSRSDFVSAEVDGTGKLLDLDVSPEALRQSYPQNIGPDTIEAIHAARAAAANAGQAKVDEILAGAHI
ncbi:YbaB/EbfC family nucleoid-associated protein [Amycolatopsis sp.]|uniref:YbaB/EbfC family nucleoid-associated protein n=1 Tax=Amycolatopsis sp. TaxID=37632 RepID=UPI002DF9BA53|nr:YbaB/EbfC family nucleoid-associated protein [Amycolatopsis sp.]